MRSWLTYIFLLMVACGTVLTSCSDVLSEEGLGTCDNRAPVRLTISFGESSPMSRDVDAGSDGTVPGLDPTTNLQKAMDANDVYLLVFNAQTGLLEYQVKDLSLSNPANDDYNTRTLSGTMLATGTGKTVKLVVLANLSQNNITVTLKNSTSLALNNKTNVQAFIDDMIGEDQTTIYEKLIYNYNVTNNGTEGIWNISNRRIPMWGITAATPVPSTGTTLDCYLYRAVAKVQIWVNQLAEEKGIEGFVINKIEVKNIHKKGYCVSTESYDENSLNYANGAKPYAAPSVPNEPGTQTVTYGSDERPLNVTQTYADQIYIPERSNTDNDAVTIDVHYTLDGEAYTGTIEFKKDGTGNRFDVIRNHSYIFNINISRTDAKLYYTVEDWDEYTINIPAFE